jgi:hypothetical protein
VGRVVTGVSRRLRTDRSGPLRIPFDTVGKVDFVVELTITRDLLTEPELERWLRDHLIARIPGSGHDE